MADSQRTGIAERDIEQAITALKKGACLLKYGRRGKPKFCPFHLTNDESQLIWYSGKEEKHINISHVSKIIPGQRTAIFQRYPRPEKEYQSFSLIWSDGSLNVICKDKEEAEVWFVGLNALISRDHFSKERTDGSVDSANSRTRRSSPSISPYDPGDSVAAHFENASQSRIGKAVSDIVAYNAVTKRFNLADPLSNLPAPPAAAAAATATDTSNNRNTATDAFRVSLSSAVSSSSQGSFHDDYDSLGDVFMWGQHIGDGASDALQPKALESTVILDVHGIACGNRHAVLVTRHGEIFSWGEEAGGRLGHGVEVDVSQPKLVDALNGSHIELVACGEYHTCAVTFSGDLYTWGDGSQSSGLLGHGNSVSHWIPRKVSEMEGIHVSYISCGLWHTTVVTSAGQLFTFGDGAFGALGHGDLTSTSIPREVEALKGFRTIRVSCGVWHTAAVVDVRSELPSPETSGSSSYGQLFTWGDGERGQLGHNDKKPRLLPECVSAFVNKKICQVACGHTLTVALTTLGQVYTTGSSDYGQLGDPLAHGHVPIQVRGKLAEAFVEEIACGSYHVAVLTSKSEVYTWGKGTNGQLGHGDTDNRAMPTLVDLLKDKQVKSVTCGSNLTAVICLHKWVSSADHAVCFGCRNAFGFRRKRHNCYNCGLVFCKVCSSKKSMKAALSPNMNKPYRVCDDCYTKLTQARKTNSALRNPKVRHGNAHLKSTETGERDSRNSKSQTTLAGFSSFGSGHQSESWHLKTESQFDAPYSCIFPSLQGASLLRDFNFVRAANTLIAAPKRTISASVPVSRGTSPASRKSSPPRSSEETELKQANESLSQEILILRTQVEDLTRKAKHLEAEFDKTAKQLKEVTLLAAEEAEKSKSAKEVIKSLTNQMKALAERMPDGQIFSFSGDSVAMDRSNHSRPSESTVSSVVTPEREPNISRPQPGTEWVVQDEPGVYVTLCSMPGGGNELKRVRFSRKQFSQGQAELWWAEHKNQVYQRHNVRNPE